MPLFLQILDGESASEAKPIVATRDPEIIASVAKALAARLGVREGGRILALVKNPVRHPRRPSPSLGGNDGPK